MPIVLGPVSPSGGDTLRTVTNPDSPVEIVKLNDPDTGLRLIGRDTFAITPPPQKPRQAILDTRYGGARTVGVAHDNAAIAGTFRITGGSANQALANIEETLREVNDFPGDRYIEWRPDGATASTFYEIRGPGAWTPKYSWALFSQRKAMELDLSWPIAPLAVSPSSTP